jgi:hypothetical protein
MDRCDKCGAKARYNIALSSSLSILLFCAHHKRVYEKALISAGAVIEEILTDS